jgi:hypothetical protein
MHRFQLLNSCNLILTTPKVEARSQNVSNERHRLLRGRKERSELLIVGNQRCNSGGGRHAKQLTTICVLVKSQEIRLRLVLLQVRLII